MTNTHSKTRILVEGALMIALSTVLSKIEIPLWMQGGSITLLSMLPIVMLGYRHGIKCGLFTAFVHSLLQLLLGFHNVMYAATLASQIGTILLDYTLAYTVLGLAPFFAAFFKKRIVGVAFGTACVCFLRFICSFLSGIVLYGAYAPAGTPVWIYSLLYNGSYMSVELILTTLGAVLLYKTAPKIFTLD